MDLWLLLHVNALVVIETVDGAGYPRLGLLLRQARNSVDVGLPFWDGQLSPVPQGSAT